MADSGTRSTAGAQTLARGISALRAVASAPAGLGVQDLADELGVHRTIAYRMLSTLADAGFIAKGTDGRYRGAAGLLTLRAAAYESLKHLAQPELSSLADRLGATVSLLVTEQNDAVAISVVEPRGTRYHIAFHQGSRHPLDRGAAGLALSAALPPRPDEPERVAEVRERGYAITHGEVEPGAWGLAVPLRVPGADLIACVNVISHREDLVRASADRVVAAAREIERRLAG